MDTVVGSFSIPAKTPCRGFKAVERFLILAATNWFPRCPADFILPFHILLWKEKIVSYAAYTQCLMIGGVKIGKGDIVYFTIFAVPTIKEEFLLYSMEYIQSVSLCLNEEVLQAVLLTVLGTFFEWCSTKLLSLLLLYSPYWDPQVTCIYPIRS